ncbi:tyrosine-type recombinase/integrase [Dehalococcoides mccartyi]|uniref:tyrosine-type recombinase/integrase n=1 Tax=Dehalococcoides mccartyi TaxID=61435 RepID=UPI0019F9B55B|nr:tyrosine-type recombinase/integrase [Dehalococcoides mccartyi]MBF4483182.1 tyrosine-type recombinase/integrase [Dehalococcoides mccartyi]MBJ7531733.1 tyrosine-type recombinase/integrase [Dehalococcoides mccartyi]
MVSQLLVEKTDLSLVVEDHQSNASEPAEDVALYHDCLVKSYLSYLKAAGYSNIPQGVRRFECGARRFLARFPDPKLWLSLSTNEQNRCDCTERGFVHYLFLRRLLPLPLTYVLSPRPHLFEMAERLMERDAYQLYQQSARRLGYRAPGVEAQFRSLLCLMIWTQKPMENLTLDDMDAFASELRVAYAKLADTRRWKLVRHGLPARWDAQLKSIRKVLYHMGIFPQLNRSTRKISFEKQWERVPPEMSATVRRYLQQLALSLRPTTAYQEKTRLFHFFSWLAGNSPEITRLDQVQRCHIEAFKEHLCHVPLQHRSNRLSGDMLAPWTRRGILSALFNFFNRLIEWQWSEAPKRALMFYQDLPILDNALPRFLDEVNATKFLEAARNHPDLFTRLCCITLIMTGMRQGEFLDLTADCIVQIGENYWLHVPLGKMHRDRFVPLNPEVKQLFDEWIGRHPLKKPYDFIFTEYGHRFGRGKIALAVARIGKAAGIKERIPPHRLRHTLATLAINRGMPLESIAALLGHRSLSMTLVYARISNRTVQQEYSQVSQHLEEICNRSDLVKSKAGGQQPTLVEGAQMRRLRQDHWRMLGNGYCTRPDGVPCEYETICESCPCFSTTVEFLPILQKQKKDAEEKGQAQRADIFTRLIQSTAK